MSKSKKLLQKNYTLPYKILKSLNFVSYYRCKDMCDIVNIDKQLLNYYLKKLKQDDFVRTIFHGSYQITESGKNFLEQLVNKQNKKMIRLENMRYKYPIYSDVNKLLESLSWKKSSLNNLDVYYVKFNEYSLRMFVGKNISIEITCKHWHGTDMHQIMWESRDDIEKTMNEFSDKFDVKLGKCESSMRPDFAIPSKMSESILKSCGLSQLKSDSTVLNKSKDRGYDYETHDIESAQLVLELPYMIEKMSKEIQEIKKYSKNNLMMNSTVQPIMFF